MSVFPTAISSVAKNRDECGKHRTADADAVTNDDDAQLTNHTPRC